MKARTNFKRLIKFPPVAFSLIIAVIYISINLFMYINQSTPQEIPTEQQEQVRVITLVAMESPTEGTYGYNMTKGGPVLILKKGELVRLVLINKGSLVHDLKIEGLEVSIGLIPPGDKGFVEFRPDKAGEFAYYCTIIGHRERGMEGKLIVEED